MHIQIAYGIEHYSSDISTASSWYHNGWIYSIELENLHHNFFVKHTQDVIQIKYKTE